MTVPSITSATSHFIIIVTLSNNLLSYFVIPATLFNNIFLHFVIIILKFVNLVLLVTFCNKCFQKVQESLCEIVALSNKNCYCKELK